VDLGLVPEDTVLNPIGLAGVVQNQNFVILRTRSHHLIEHVKVGKDSKEGLVQLFAILDDVLAGDEYVVHVGAEVGTQVHTVLHCQHEKYLPVASVHETLADARVLEELAVVHTVVHEDECTNVPRSQLRLSRRRLEVHHLSLPVNHPLDNVLVIFPIDEQVRNELLIPVIALFGRRHNYACWEMLFVI